MTCIVCADNTPCAGRIVCGDLPNCNDPACGNTEKYPPPISNAEFYCNTITANAEYRIHFQRPTRLQIIAAEPDRITLLEGFQDADLYYNAFTLVSTTPIDRILATPEHRDAFYALNRYIVVAATGDPRNASDGDISETNPPTRIPKNAGGVLTVGTETL